jgi:hypothetical protein
VTSASPAGEGPASEVFEVTTLPTAPSAVRGLRLETVWTDPFTLVRACSHFLFRKGLSVY